MGAQERRAVLLVGPQVALLVAPRDELRAAQQAEALLVVAECCNSAPHP